MKQIRHSFGKGDHEIDEFWEELDNEDDVGQWADGDIHDNLDDGFFRA